MFSWMTCGIHQKGAHPRRYLQVEMPEMSSQKDHKVNIDMFLESLAKCIGEFYSKYYSVLLPDTTPNHTEVSGRAIRCIDKL